MQRYGRAIPARVERCTRYEGPHRLGKSDFCVGYGRAGFVASNGTGAGGAGRRCEAGSGTKQFSLGGADFGPLELRAFDYAEPAGTDGFIGYNFFARHIVCIDFPGKRFLIRR